MGANNIKEFKRLVIAELEKKYGLNEFDAIKAVRSSYLTIALKVDAETAMHDSIEEWAVFGMKKDFMSAFSNCNNLIFLSIPPA